jgi:hypothetical protein
MEDFTPIQSLKTTWLLLKFPIDILAVVTSFVDGFSIGRLLLIGDKSFSRKLGELGGIPSFEIEAEARNALPPSSFLSKLPKLRQLHINIVGSVNQESLTSLRPSQLPSGLVKIEFKFRWAEWIWKSLSTHRMVDPSLVFASPLEEEAYKELQVAKMFPCLEKLVLDGWPTLRDAFILVLPNLTEFALPSNPFLTPNCISYLPKDLLTISLPSAREWPPSAFEALPSGLTSLDWGHAEHLDSSVFLALPRTLEYLKLGYILLNNDDMANLPRSLQKLDFTADASRTTSPGFHLLPDGLLHLKYILFQTRLVTDSSLTDLPRNLKSLHLNSKVVSDHGFSALPPKLTSVTFSDLKLLSPKCFEVMPPTITSLKLPVCTNLGPDDIPTSKTHLKFSSMVTSTK